MYVLGYRYDRDSRRTRLLEPGFSDSLIYTYSPANGALAAVRDGPGHRYELTYTPAGRLDSLKIFPTAGAQTPGIKESHRYDADGRLTRRERQTGTGTTLQLDTLRYDAQGRVIDARTQSAAINQATQKTTTFYAGHGAVLASERTQGTTGKPKSSATTPWATFITATGAAGTTPAKTPQRSIYDAHGLLTQRTGDLPTNCGYPPFQDTLYTVGDNTPNPGGNAIRSGEVHVPCQGAGSQIANTFYNTIDGRLSTTQQDNTAGDDWEEYWYDALGRRSSHARGARR